ncbi:MAG: class I SAM-dependent methyltransferase [Alphaproteobacteria bacterium]
MAGDFYDSDLVVASYDLLTEQANRQIEGDAAFYLDCARRYGAPVLELGVGTGRIAWALAEAGHQVVGIDRSGKMLAAARRKGEALSAGLRARLALHRDDIATFEVNRRFPLALIPFSTFQHLTTPEAQRACLVQVRHHLEAEGRLILDIFDPVLDACVPGAGTPNPTREAIDPATGDVLRRFTVSRINDPLTQSFRETFRLERYDRSGELLLRDEATHHLRWATRQEMTYLFELTGFGVEAEYSDFERSPPAYGQRQIWVVRPV